MGERKVPAWPIPLEKGKVVESLKKGIEKVRKGEAGPGELTGYKNMRGVGDAIKGTIDEQLALPLFCQVERFVRGLSTKHFKVS